MKKNPPPTPSFAHKLLRGTLAVAQVFSALSATIIGIAQPTLPDAIASLQPLIGLPNAALADYNAGAPAGTTLITGTVYQDYNSNGVMNTTGISPNLSIDWGVGNVTVSGVCVTSLGADGVIGTADDVYANSTAVQTAASSYVTTSATTIGGQYTLTVPAGALVGTASQPSCRVSFSGFPSGYYPAPVGASGSVITPDNRSDVQFVNPDTANVSFGLSVPEDYSQNNPRVAIPIHAPGNITPTITLSPALYSFTYGASKTGDGTGIPNALQTGSGVENPTADATQSQIGATWGLGYYRQAKRLFAAAVLQRQVGLGPLGLGGIYVADYSSGTGTYAGSFNLQGVTPANGGSAIDLGSVTRVIVTGAGTNATDNGLNNDPTQPSKDIDAFAKIGKVGFGDIDVDEGRSTLWAVNLNQRALVSINVGNYTASTNGPLPGTVNQYLLSSLGGVPTCTNGVFRPWALKMSHGIGYLGGVCSAENAAASGTYGSTNIGFYVLKFDPANPTAGFTTLASAANYNHNEESGLFYKWCDDPQANQSQTACNYQADGVFRNVPQPMLTDIEFRADGALIVGVTDRYGLQQMSRNYDARSGASTILFNRSNGDLLLWCNVNGSYVAESAAGCAVNDPATAPSTRLTTAPLSWLTTDGLNGTGEFFYGDYFLGNPSATLGAAQHNETSLGALALLPGSQEVLSSVFDPVNLVDTDPGGGFGAQGVRWYNTQSGNLNTAYQLIDYPYSNFTPPPLFAKGNGLGDIELLSDPAPIEIGNRVWWDPDLDGVQDPGEKGIPNVTMTLWLVHNGTAFADGQALPAGATLVATTTTNAAGNYYFSYEGDATKDGVNGYSNQTWANIGTNFALTGYDTVVQGTPIAASGVVTTSGLITHNKVLPNVVYQVRIAGATTGGSANYTVIDSVDTGTTGFTMSPKNNAGSYWLDTNAYDNPGNAAAFAPIGGVGENEHAYDFAFGPYPTLKIVKQVLGGATTSPFTMTVTGPSGYSVITTVTTSASRAFTVPYVGTYTVTESSLPAAPAGLQWIGAIYEPDSDGTVTLSSAQTGTVTVTNMLGAVATGNSVLTVTKTVVGSGVGPYNITVNGPSGVVSSTTIAANQTITFAVPSGIYTVTESAPSGTIVTYTASSSGFTTPTTNSTSGVVTLTNAITTSRFAATQITGRVYNDYNSDGNITANGTITDSGVQNVTVTAYDVTGAAVGSTTTSASGLYTFTPTAQGPYRIEFTNLPAGYEPSRVFTGTQNGTSVQFINTAAQATGLNFGVLHPDDYTQNNPAIQFLRQEGGDSTGSNANARTLVAIASSATSGIFAPPTTGVVFSQTGATWGLAYQRETKLTFAASMLKRHVGAPNGLDAVYVMDSSNPLNPAFLGSFNLSGITPVNGGAAIDLGTVCRSAACASNAGNTGIAADYTLLANPTLPTVDLDAFAKSGRTGIGDIDIDPNTNRLWLVNTNQQALISLDASGAFGSLPADVRQFPLTTAANMPACTGGSLRPWALKFYRDRGYLGVVCDAATSRSTADLKSYVVSFDPANPISFSPEITLAMSYPRVSTNIDWKPWARTSTDIATNANFPNLGYYSQPLLGDIEFADDGSLTVSFIDRTSIQIAPANRIPVSGAATNVINSFRSSAGMVKYCRVGAGFVVEGTAGTCPSSAGLANNGPGPSRVSFYYEVAGDQTAIAPLGALARQPGSNRLISTFIDPYSGGSAVVDTFSQGVQWLTESTGALAPKYYGFAASNAGAPPSNGNPTNSQFFGKSNGMGDVEIISDPAPIEIGNRVWWDIDGDGVQDAGEPGIAGSTVTLQGPGGVVSTTTTDANGQYTFRAETAVAGAQFSTTLRPYTVYTLSLSTPGGYTLTVPNSGGIATNAAITDVRDSDAYLNSAGTPTIFYQTGSYGQNNHGLDFGFVRPTTGTVAITNQYVPASLQIVKQVLGGSSSSPFTFTVAGPSGYNVITTVTSSVARVITNLVAGTYTVTESSVPGAPVNLIWTGVAYEPVAQLSLIGGQTSTITVTNMLGNIPTNAAILTVTKQVNGNAPAGQTYNVTITGPSGVVSNTTIAANQTLTFAVTPGIYTVTEASPGAGWLVTYTASSTGNPVSVTNGTSAVVTLTNPNTATTFAATQITGRVYNDYNSDGNITANGVVTDSGVQGVTVTAYDLTGAAVGSTTTSASGLYTFTPTAQGPYRIEFTNLPAGYEPSRVFTGTQNGTSVQFINTAAQATGVNFGVIYPADYSQANPPVAVPSMVNGDTNATSPVAAMFRFAYGAANGSTNAQTAIADKSEIGSTWGLAYARTTTTLYASAVLRRHTGLGSGGLGAIYQIPNANTGAGGTPSVFYTVANVGTVASNATRGLAGPEAPSQDASVYDDIGTIGMGDIDISDDESALWTINLNTKSLLKIPTANPSDASVTSYALPSDPGGLCPASTGQVRPWATKYYRGNVYVGLVCDAAVSQNVNGLKAWVYAFDPTTAGFTLRLTVPLTYTKGDGTADCNDPTTGTRWNPWSDTEHVCSNGGAINTLYTYPQPILSDIEFDGDGSMILGFVDRFGLQVGYNNRGPNSASGSAEDGALSGDILRAYNNNGTFVLESNGVVGPLTTASSANNQGPGGREFYNDTGLASNAASAFHEERSQGGLALLPGSGQVMMSVMDPLGFSSSGVTWLSNVNGADVKAIRLTEDYQNCGGVTCLGNFAKAASLGDLELLSDPAPIEIGNRVWQDNNGNGIQDAGELGIAGQTVTLLGPSGVPSTTVTDANGNYYFTREATTGSYSTTLRPYTLYTISLTTPAGYTLTVPNANGLSTNTAITDVRDSDAYLTSAGTPTIFYQTGSYGQNNHGLDFGFVKPFTGTVQITNTVPAFDLGNYVWFDTNNNGITDTGELGVAGVTVTLRTVTGTITTTTNAQGYYSFTNLPAGTYTPTIAAANFALGGPLANYLSSGGASSIYTAAGNGLDHGIDPANAAAYVANGVSGAAVTLGNSLPPTGEDTGAPTTPNGDALNNLTADFGFYRQQIGNTIWVDSNNNGVLDSGELPYASGPITVTLVDNTTGAVVSQTVTNNGIYTFTGVPSGTYVVSITVPSGFTSSTPTTNTTGIDNDDNGSASGAFIVSAPFTATPGTNAGTITSSNANGTTVNPSIDFGLFAQVMSLGNYVWLDTNNDGVVNSGETGVSSVAVELYFDSNGDGVFSAGDVLVGSTSTNASGYYSFTNLVATTNTNSAYIVVISNTNFVGAGPGTGVLAGYRSSEGNGLSAPDPDNDVDSDDNGDPIGAYGAAGFVVASKPINLTASGEPTNETSNPGWSVGTPDANSNATVDFGFYRQQVGNTIWLDANDNGLLDGGELPYTAGPITVTLVDNATGAVVSTTTTSTGIYTFTGVPSGTFVVSITVPSGFRSSTPTTSTVGADSNDNGSPSGAFIVSAPFTATPGSNINTVASSNATGTTLNPSIDFGLYAPVVNLGNRVWLDTDNDGLLDGTEVGRDSVRVELYGDTDGNGVYTPGVDTFVRFSDTVNGGYYTFTALPEGAYVVVITSTNFVNGGALFGYSNSSATEANINANQDETVGGDNGTTTGTLGGAGYVSSAAISLTVGSEPSATTAAGDSNWTVDFGFYKLEVGNQVWYDTNNDGLFGGSEVGVGGVAVALLDGAGNVVSTTSTNGSGFYTFTNLAGGSYRVVITAPVGYRSSATNSTTALNADNDDDGISQQPVANGTVITSALFTLTAGSSGTSVATNSDGTTRNPAADFGIYKLEVGNQVWFDDNNNGVRDAGETFAPNIAVAILDTAGNVISTTTTDAGGNYTFTGLISGTYVISITPPVGAFSSNGQIITDGLNLNDHGAPSGAFIVSQPFDVTPGGGGSTNETATNSTGTTVNYNLDFGLWRPVSLGNYVWFDTNNDGQLGGLEVGVGSVAVELYYDTNNDGAYSPGDVLVSSTTTSNSGYYSFTNLQPTNGVGSAYVVVISSTNFIGNGPLANYRSSTGNGASAPDPDGDVDNDDNGDEIGSYATSLLVSSKAITLTPNTEPTSEAGGNGANDPTSDSNSNLTVDFGFYKLEVGNQVWIDANDDGQLGGLEVGVGSVAVALMDNAGNVVSTTTTNAQGYYTFTALLSGTYVISVTPPAGYRSSTGQIATDALNENDHGAPSGAFITSQQFALTPGGGAGTNETANNATGTTQNPNLDFGLYLPRVSLGNYVWFDTDNDGQLGGLEVGVGSVAVELYQDTNNDGVFDAGDVRISTTTTSGTGYYSFTNLVPTMGAGTAYLVVITNTNFVGAGALAGYRSSDGNGVSSPDPDNDVDSDDNGDESGLYGAANFMVASKAISVTDLGEPTNELGGNGANDPTRDADSNLTVDFGFYRLQLGNLVWEDLNNDGDFDAGEPTLNGVAVTLYASDGNTVVSTTVTNASGNYTFTGLLSGTYIVAVTPPAGYKSSTGASNIYEPGATTFTGATDNTDHGTNAGAEIRSAAIVLRPGDTVTNGSGNAITQNNGNTANPTVDFGLWRPASLGDYVWQDTDRDGVQDAGETGVDGVIVTLLNTAGQIISTTTTGPNGATNGYYTFTNLISGTYVVSFTLPNGYAWTQTNVGADGTDSDAVPQVNPNSLFAVTGPYVLNAGESNPTVDAGVILPTVYLGNRVWFDTNNDGLDNDGAGATSGSSTGTDGVTLDLYKDTNGDGIYTPGVDQFVSTTVSAGGGFYNFTNLLQGAYVVVITSTNFVGGALNGYQSSTDIASTTTPDGNLDRDDNGVTTGALGVTGAYVSSRAITLTYASEPSGQNEAYDVNGNGSLDFGFYKLSIGDTVFEDYNNNGVQDAGEPGIPNVPVALYDSTGTTVLQSTTTDANGVYTFTGLTDDLGYVVGITMTTGYTSSTDIGTSTTPGNNVNRDDNGVNVNGLVVKSNVITPNAGALGATGANTVTATTGSTNDPTVDFGIWRPASLGNYVWEDIDNNGQQNEASNFGVNGVQVTLFVFSPTLNAYAVAGTTTTASDPAGNPGYYTFTNLISGTYVVAFTAPSGYTFTKQDTGGEPGDSDANPISGQTGPVVLNAGDVNPTVDAGLFRPLSLGNRVFIDNDNNGLDDGAGGGANGSSAGVDGVTVNLYRDTNGNGVLDGADTAVSNTTTTNGGYYTFTNLFSGTYLVQLPPSNFASGGPLFNRANSTGNGTATTDSNTNFDDDGREQGSVDNIVSGPITLTAGLEPLNDGAAANDPIADVNGNYTVDFGFYPLASIGDRVWHDYNANGIQDTEEITGVSGVEVVLYNAITGSPVATTTTGVTGDYTFTKLPPGQYFVQFNLPPVGWATSPADQAGVANDAGDAPNDSDGTPVPGFPNVLRTTTVTLGADENDPRWDQGIYFTASLGDRMWEDLDRNGVQDAGEPGVIGITVTLYANGVPISTTQTITNGFYEFKDLTPGVPYSVGFSLPSGYNFTLPNVNTNLSDTVDSDADVVTGGTSVVTLASGQRYPDLDAGIWRPAGIGDRVWLDNDRDGLQTITDTGVPNVVVNLWQNGAVISTTQTDPSGYYSFTGLIPGAYSLTFGLPAGYARTLQDALGNTQDISDSDALTTTGATTTTVLTSGEYDPTWDEGLYQLASLGDYVWEDINHDGVQNENTPIQGVTVVLYDANDVPVLTTTTSITGFYQFTNLEPGNYSVGFTAPVGYTFTKQNNNNPDTSNLDSDVPLSGRTIQVNLVPGENDPNLDAGLWRPAKLGDYVWEDLDADGVQDANEPGVNGVAVALIDAVTGQVVSTTTTYNFLGQNGYYTFTDLISGTYVVSFTAPAPLPGGSGGYYFTAPNVLTDTTDSDAVPTANPLVGTTGSYPIFPGDNNPTVDAGIVRPASLGDRVWLDNDRDGRQNGGDTGVPSVTVQLLNAAGAVISTTTTDANGYYTFSNLSPGDYAVQFTLPNGYTYTKQDSGLGDADDSDANPITSRTITTTLISGENDPTWDAGIYPLAGIGDRVWYDVNANGIQDTNEITGVAGVTVTLYDISGTVVATMQTDANGLYSFTNLLPGDYSVGFSLPAGWGRSPQDREQNGDDKDSDANIVTGRTTTTTLNPGEYDPTWDSGIFELASLGDYVWEDLNHNGRQDFGEPPIQGVTVTLYAADGTTVLLTITTSITGFYQFAGLTPTTFIVGFTTPSSYSPTVRGTDPLSGNDSNPNPADGKTNPVTLAPGENNPTIDAGYWRPASLGDYVWEDYDNDGQQELGEPGINGVLVTLLDNNGNVISTTTTANYLGTDGYYTFTNLISGTYVVSFTNPAGYRVTKSDTGGEPTDSDGVSNGLASVTGPYVLNAGESIPTVDMGYWRPASLGNYVWYDDNVNGLNDEPSSGATAHGVNGVTVRLYASDGTTLISTTVTANDPSGNPGYYTFTDLISGSYQVAFDLTTLPAGYQVTKEGPAAGKDFIDSDAISTTGRTETVTLTAGEADPTWDMGIWKPSGLGDYVWEDYDHDGVQDANEPGVSGVTVNLLDDVGSVISTTTTGPNGYYSFTQLKPGTYAVEFVKPTVGGYEFTQPTQGISTTDSNADVVTGQTAPVTLGPGEFNPTIDAGLWRPASLGDYVWEDINHDGIQNDGATGVNGVLVTLLDDEGNVIGTMTTFTGGPNNTEGYYTFTQLISDTYVMSFTLPVGYQWTVPNANGNGNDTSDSDGIPQGNIAVTGPYVLNAGESIPTVDQGVWRPASVGNYVWMDDDRDGVNDEPADRGVNGVTVRLLDNEGFPISTTVTANDPNGNPGYYTFTNLAPDRYTVEFDLTTLPGGYTVTVQGASGSKDAADSDADPVTGQTDEITLVTGEADPTWDMGIWTPASLGDYVWEDWDHDGIQDLNEPPVQGVQVVLYDGATNTPILTATTSITGYYRFDGLLPSVPYYVGFTAPPQPPGSGAGYEFTQQGSNPISALDSNANPVTGQTAPVILVSGEHNPTLDAGLFRPASLGDYVWEDTNANGTQDESATGVNGVFVELLDVNGNVVSTTTTFTGGPNNAAGYYTFTNLISNTYQVRFTAPQGYSITKANVGADGTDSDGVPQGGLVAQTGLVVLNAGESNPTVDLGLFKPASLGDRVWYDYDVDGIQDSNEVTGVVGVQVVLYDAVTNRPVATTTTGADGYYSFTALTPGSYFVEFTLPTGYGRSPGDVSGVGKDATDSDANQTTGRTVPVTLVSGENDPTWDAGIYQLSSLGDRVWEDKNLNGTQEGGEPGVPGVVVTLYLNGVPISTTTTDASGFYGFFNLTPTVPYTLAFALPAGYHGFTKVDVGSDATDSDANPVTGATGPITLLPGENNPNVDAGVIKPAGLGDYVWVDVNRDGQQQTGEPGIPGVVVTLYSNGVPVGTTTTNASGFYSFTNLTPGVPYSVSFGLPGGFAWTLPTVGITTTDSNVDANGSTTPVTLVSGEFNPTIDAGVISTLKLDKVGVGSGINGAIGKDKLITYTLVVSNTGAGAISNVTVDDPLMATQSYAGRSAPPPVSTNPLKWDLGTLNPGQAKTIVFVVNAIVNTGTLTNVAYVSGPLGDKQILMAQDAASTSFAPDVVALMKFEAKREKGGVKIIWQTSQEVNTFGFALYRSESFDSAQDAKRGEAVLATPELIPAQGRTGGTYAYLDATAKANKRYTYWLIEAETTGAMNEYGPTEVGAEATEVALQPNAVAAAGGVPVAGLPIAVAGPVKQLGQRVLVETQPQTVNAVVVQQAADNRQQTTPSQTAVVAPAQVAPVSRQAVMEAMANPPKPQAQQVAPQRAVVAEQVAPSAVSDVGASAVSAPVQNIAAQAESAKAQPETRAASGNTSGLLIALLVAGLMLMAAAGAAMVFLRSRGRRQ